MESSTFSALFATEKIFAFSYCPLLKHEQKYTHLKSVENN